MMRAARQGLETLGGLGRLVLDTAFPPSCPACLALVDTQDNFCSACFDTLTQISAPHCACCGIPFAFDLGSDMQCPTCLADAPHYTTVRAPLVYDATSAPLVRSLKFHDRYTGLNRAVRMMDAALGAHRTAIDAVVPVPLHWRRLVVRRYNQSALLGFALARRLGVPCRPGLLTRVKYTTPQMRLTREQRLRNVRGAFAVPASADVAGKTLLLVDDVVTTGATVDACAAVLMQAGAAAVHCVALARTVKD